MLSQMDDYPLHQIVFFRSCVALILTVAIIMPLDGGFKNIRTKRLRMHLLRGLSVVIANLTFFAGIVTLSLSDATAIFFVAPLLISPVHSPAGRDSGRVSPERRRGWSGWCDYRHPPR